MCVFPLRIWFFSDDRKRLSELISSFSGLRESVLSSSWLAYKNALHNLSYALLSELPIGWGGGVESTPHPLLKTSPARIGFRKKSELLVLPNLSKKDR